MDTVHIFCVNEGHCKALSETYVRHAEHKSFGTISVLHVLTSFTFITGKVGRKTELGEPCNKESLNVDSKFALRSSLSISGVQPRNPDALNRYSSNIQFYNN